MEEVDLHTGVPQLPWLIAISADVSYIFLREAEFVFYLQFFFLIKCEHTLLHSPSQACGLNAGQVWSVCTCFRPCLHLSIADIQEFHSPLTHIMNTY